MVEAPAIEKDKKVTSRKKVVKESGGKDIGEQLAEALRETLREKDKKIKTKKVKPRRKQHKERFKSTEAAMQLEKKRKKIKSTSDNIEDARLNLQVSRDALRTERPRRRSVFNKSLKEKEKDNEKLMGIALKEHEESLLELNTHLYKLVNTGTPDDNAQLFDRYVSLFDDLKELHEEKIQKTTSLDERAGYLLEYEELLKDRVNVCIEIAEARGFELISGKPEKKNLETHNKKRPFFIVREIDTLPPVGEEAKSYIVEMKQERGDIDYRTTAVKIELNENTDFTQEEYMDRWKALKKAQVPVPKMAMKDRGNERILFTSDLSIGQKLSTWDHERLRLYKDNHKELPEKLRKKKKTVVDTLVNCAERASDVGYHLKPEAFRFVVGKEQVKVYVFDLLRGLERKYKLPIEILGENINTIRRMSINNLELMSEDEWNRYYPKYSTEQKPQTEKMAA